MRLFERSASGGDSTELRGLSDSTASVQRQRSGNDLFPFGMRILATGSRSRAKTAAAMDFRTVFSLNHVLSIVFALVMITREKAVGSSPSAAGTP